MTLIEFYNLNHLEYVYIDGELFQYSANVCNDLFVKADDLSSLYYCVNRRNEVFYYIDGERICNINFNEFLNSLSIKSKQNQIQEIQSLKIELQNIQKKIEKLEEENQLELGGIYEVSYQGNIIKGCLVEDLKNCYRFITKTTALYLLEKNLITSFKKLPDESVKQFFKKTST